MADRTFSFLPGGRTGWWSVGLIAVMPVLFQIGFFIATSWYPSIPAGSTIPTDLAARPFVGLTMLTGMAAGIGAFFSGLFAVVKHKEKALLVYAATVLGGLVILYLAAELLFPH